MKAFLVYQGDSQFIVEAESLEQAEAGIEKYNNNGFPKDGEAKVERELTEAEMKTKEETGRYELEGASFTEGEEISDGE